MRIVLINGDGTPFPGGDPKGEGDDTEFIARTHGLPRRAHPEHPEWIRPYNPAAWDLSLGALPVRYDRFIAFFIRHPDLWFYVEPDGRSGKGTV